MYILLTISRLCTVNISSCVRSDVDFPHPSNILMVMQMNKGIRTTAFESDDVDLCLSDVLVGVSMPG